MKTKLLIASILLLGFVITAFPQKKEAGLFWIREDGKYGYIDKTGKVVIAPQYENTMGFNEGLAATKLNGKYGFIDKKGNWAIKPQYDFTYIFMDGLAAVTINKQTAFIDKFGKIVIQPTTFEETAMGFSEGRLAVKKEGKWGYIDKIGKVIVEPKFKKATKFENGAAQVETTDGMHHWIDSTGKILWSQKSTENKSGMKDSH